MRTRSKSRKPKFLSLRRHLITTNPNPHPNQPPVAMTDHQLDNDPQMACLLQQEEDADAGATMITTLFAAAASSSAALDHHHEVLSPAASSSMNWDGDGLARRALRGRERWVFCRSFSEEVASDDRGLVGCCSRGGLSLKLDYEEILTAWSDRGSLYIDGEGPQVVPQLLPHGCCCSAQDSIGQTMLVEVENGGVWRVPEVEEGEEVDGEQRKKDNSSCREASVMRYKEKRQNRLFSKRIRYEVRKLNAEKRPRIKGRFVKRSDDM